MIVKLLTEPHLEFLILKGGCRGSSESIHISKCHIVGNLMPRLISCLAPNVLMSTIFIYVDLRRNKSRHVNILLQIEVCSLTLIGAKLILSTNLLQNAAKLIHGEKHTSSRFV